MTRLSYNCLGETLMQNPMAWEMDLSVVYSSIEVVYALEMVRSILQCYSMGIYIP